MAQQVFRVGDKVDFGTTNQSVGTVLETSALAGSGKQIVRLDLSWAASYWYPADLLRLVPHPKAYRFVQPGFAGSLWTEDVATKNPILYSYSDNGLMDVQRKTALRAGMVALGYTEEV